MSTETNEDESENPISEVCGNVNASISKINVNVYGSPTTTGISGSYEFPAMAISTCNVPVNGLSRAEGRPLNVYVSSETTGTPSSEFHPPTTGIPPTDVHWCTTGIPSHSFYESTGNSWNNLHGPLNTGIPINVHDIYGLSKTLMLPPRLRTTNIPYDDVEGVLSEKLTSFKRSYSSYKGHLTRIYNEIDRAIKLSDKHLVEEKRNTMESTFKELTRIYDKMMQLMDLHERETFTKEHTNEIQRRGACLLKCGQWLTTVNDQASKATVPAATRDLTTTTVVPSPHMFKHFASVNLTEEGDRWSRKSYSRMSSKSSRSSTRSRASTKAKLEKARLRLQRLDERKELEKKLEEHRLRTEIEEAEIDMRVVDEIDSDGSQNEFLDLPIQSDGEKIVKILDYLEECSQSSKVQHTDVSPDVKHVDVRLEVEHMDVKPEVKHVDVSPKVKYADVKREVEHVNVNPEVKYVDVKPVVKHVDVKTEVKFGDVSPEVKHEDVNPEVKHVDVNPEGKHVDVKPKVQHANVKSEAKYVDVNPEIKRVDVKPEVKHVEVKPEAKHVDVNPKVKLEDVEREVNESHVYSEDGDQSFRSDESHKGQVFSNETDYDFLQDRTDGDIRSAHTTNTSTVFNVLRKQQETMDEVVRTLSMPKRGYMSFDGDPLMFPLFIKNFEINIEGRETHDSDRLSYLIQFCKGKARESIEHCVMMPPSEGYCKAKDILKKNFGRTHVVSKAFLDKVVKGSCIKITESERLSQLSRDMETCLLGSSELGLESSLNSLDTLGKVVNRLPITLKAKWAERASQIYDQGLTPTFLHLAKFIEQRATVANTYFGQLIQDNRADRDVKIKTRAYGGPAAKVTTLATTSNKNHSEEKASQIKTWRPHCPLCGKEHYLDQCESFREKTGKQRMDVTSERELCRKCLKGGHVAKNCRKTRACNEGGCKGNHHPLLHTALVNEQRPRSQPSLSSDKIVPREETKSETDNSSATTKSPSTVHSRTANVAHNNALRTDSRLVSLKVIPVKVKAPNGDREVETYAFLDDGSDTSMCLQSLADDLGIKGEPVRFILSTMTGDQENNGRQLSLDVTGVSTEKGVRITNVWTTNRLPITEENVVVKQDVSEMNHMKDIDLPELIDKKITLLIGSDVPEALCPLEVRSGKKGEPFALRTLLGWTVTGPLRKGSRQRASMNYIHVDQSIGCNESEPVLTNIHDDFVRMYNSEFSECTAEVRECLSVEDQRAKKIMDKTVEFVNGHYQIGLPWKYERPQLSDNKSMAETRLMLLKKRLLKDHKLLTKYTETMEQYISRGHAEKVQASDHKEQSNRTSPRWYLPHHPVMHQQKPEKVRVVYDCAASYNGTSLNEQLLQGPDNTNSLVGVLLRFRKERVAFLSDVEQMFHQVYVQPSDRNALRFLWWPNGDLQGEPEEYNMNVHLFGATSSPSVCSYALHKAAEDSREEYSVQTIETINNSFYVDDCLKSVANVNEAISLVKELTSLLAKRGFRLTKWVSNEREVLSAVPSMERARSVSLDMEKLPVERALGVQWDVERDMLGFRQGKETSSTRRGILSFVASIYDPLGLAAPFVLPAKMMLQQLCRLNHDWDASLSEGCLKKWAEIKKTVEKLMEVQIPRCYKSPTLKEIRRAELHHFADASAEGYGTASYIRLVDIEDNVHCTLIMGKSRVAPLKTITIPRLELSAATLAVKVNKQIRQELQMPIHRVVFWTDSVIVIGYIRNVSKRFHTFVANRLQIIHDASSPEQWRHVPTESNPADLSSRGIKVNDEKEMCKWFNGPEFLQREEDYWPSSPDNEQEIGDEDAEVKGSKAQMYAQVKANVDVKNVTTSLDELLHRWSSWYRLCKMVAWLLRYKRYLMWHFNKTKHPAVSSEPLKVNEMSEAEVEVIKLVQKEAFPSAPTKMRTKHGAKIVHDRLQNLSPITENGVLRVGGRLTNAPLDETHKHQAILPSSHHVTSMIIRHYHKHNGHTGRNQTLAAIRKKFWIIKGPSTVRRVLNSCVPCRRQSQQTPTQIMAPLPKARVTPGRPPFTSTGVDYFGPLHVKYRRGTAKRYGCIFTCLSVRAVHIEVSSDLTSDSFIQAVCRFVSRRGAPIELYSDNGSNFRGAESEIKEALKQWNQEKIRERLREKEIQWYFNAPSASHTGGVWERMIRSTRRILRATVGNQLLDDETLSTTLCEVEKIINDRPLTAVSNDPRDMEVLTPNSLLLLRPNSCATPCPNDDNIAARERWKLAQSLADSFWKRWVAEYLPTLQERQKWLKKQKNVLKGDLVMIKDDSLQRGQWPLGRIMETYPDNLGVVRRVLVRTAKGSYERDIRKLSLLEQQEDSDDTP